MSGAVIRATRSVCPVCLRQIEARQVRRGGEVFLEKTCPAHGAFAAVVWRGEPALESWRGDTPPIDQDDRAPCPDGCGLCEYHRQDTCCVLVEVTARCNLRCRFCFADNPPPDPGREELAEIFRELAGAGRTFLQLSGGEPTLRDDLPELVADARAAGMEYVQLNSNGLRLAGDEDFVAALARAGLSFVFLQFDGVEDAVYETLRGKALLAEKRRAIELCGKYRIGVTLVPTVVPGVNDKQLWEIVRFGAALSPAVRGVHFQPVSYFGRYPHPPADSERITLPELLVRLEEQSGGALSVSDFSPSRCDHPQCGFHGDFLATAEGLERLARRGPERGCCGSEALRNRHYVGRRWSRTESGFVENQAAPDSLDGFLERVRAGAFTVSAMAFQDGHTIDLERLRRCSLHVHHEGKIVPFCARYLTGINEIGGKSHPPGGDAG